MSEWPDLPEGWTYAGMTERVDFYFAPRPKPEHPCDVNWGSHGCDLERGHKRGHVCDPCTHHPWWLHAVLYRAAHLLKRSGRIGYWWGGCVERWPWYGKSTRFYGEDAP